jgi:hypothetical protein
VIAYIQGQPCLQTAQNYPSQGKKPQSVPGLLSAALRNQDIPRAVHTEQRFVRYPTVSFSFFVFCHEIIMAIFVVLVYYVNIDIYSQSRYAPFEPLNKYSYIRVNGIP